MTVETTDKIYLRGHLLTKEECSWYDHDLGNVLSMFPVFTIGIGMFPLGLYGTVRLFTHQEWWWPWQVLAHYPWTWFPCLLFGLWSAYNFHLKPWISSYAKRSKMENGRYSQADIDNWTMQVKGKTYRTDQGQMPTIMYDITLDAFMANRTLN